MAATESATDTTGSSADTTESPSDTILPEDTIDFKLKSLKKCLEKLTCTGAGIKSEDDVPYGSKPLPMPLPPKVDDTTATKPSLAVPDEGTSVDPLTPEPKRDLPTPPVGEKGSFEENNIPPVVKDISAAEQKDLDKLMADLTVADHDPTMYRMSNKARGLFVLFNVVNFGDAKMKRDGTDEDADQIMRTFEKMHFEVIRYDDPKADEMVQIMKTVASFDHTDVDCVSVCILTHGTWSLYERKDNSKAIADTVLASDEHLQLEALTSPFRVPNCHKSLRGKPKLFFIQACRGEKLAERAEYYDTYQATVNPKTEQPSQQYDTDTDTAPQQEDAVAAPDPSCTSNAPPSSKPEDRGDSGDWVDRQAHSLPETMPIYKDFLVAWSTAPGYFSFRNVDKGSVFIQTLCRYLAQFHQTTDLLSILTWCNSDIAHQYQSFAPSTVKNPIKRDIHRKKQMPWFFSRLTKDIIFTPKP